MGQRSKAQKGDGVCQMADGTWMATIDYGRKPNGDRDRRRKRFATEREARTWKHEQETLKRKGMLPALTRETVETFARRWLSDVVRPSRRASTAADYEANVRLNILPALGKVKLSALTAAQVQSAYRAMAEQGSSPAKVRHVHRVLRAMLNHAVHEGALAVNPAIKAGKALPPVPRKRMKVWTPEQARRFLDVALMDAHGPLWDLLLFTGCRIGEALALTWRDVDFKAGEIRIEASMDPTSPRVRQDAPKTEAGRRTIALPSALLGALKDLRRGQREAQMRGNFRPEVDYVFATAPGVPLTRHAAHHRFKRLLAKAGLPDIRLHDLRHTCASVLLSEGTPIPDVQERLGHSSPATTMNIYAHAIPGRQKAATEKLESLFYQGHG